MANMGKTMCQKKFIHPQRNIFHVHLPKAYGDGSDWQWVPMGPHVAESNSQVPHVLMRFNGDRFFKWFCNLGEGNGGNGTGGYVTHQWRLCGAPRKKNRLVGLLVDLLTFEKPISLPVQLRFFRFVKNKGIGILHTRF